MNNSNSGGQKEEQGIPREYIDWAESDALEAYEVSSYQKPLGKTMWLTAANKMAVAAYRKLFERKECIDLLALVPGISPEAVMQILQLNATQLRDYEKALFESEQKVKQLSEKREGPVLNGWIDVNDSWPPDKRDVLIFGQECVSIGWYETDGDNSHMFYDEINGEYNHMFTHWQYLPAFPHSPSLTRDVEREEGERKYSRGELLAVNAEYEKYVMKVIVDSSHPQPAMRFGIWFDKNFPILDKIYCKNCGLGFWECKLSCGKWEPTALYNLAEYGRTAEGKKEEGEEQFGKCICVEKIGDNAGCSHPHCDFFGKHALNSKY